MGKTNGLAVASLILGIIGICAFPICAPIAFILGLVANGQIKRTGQDGKGMAIAGIILGIVGTIFWIIGTILYILILGASFAMGT
ncbi:MAG: DUF4190 domain-containing protein [Candidatus Thermoplasmatota archaeon]|nr:DUF4190 domain-containing protein [Candidatus Thermoplasmatota archaeon]